MTNKRKHEEIQIKRSDEANKLAREFPFIKEYHIPPSTLNSIARAIEKRKNLEDKVKERILNELLQINGYNR